MDIKCVVCGEPWDAYGVLHGDMLPWEAELFRSGAGCPGCDGELPEEPFEPQSLSDLENGDEDPMDRIVAYKSRGKRPPWKAPKPEVQWKCSACGIQVETLPTDPEHKPGRPVLVYHVPRDAPAHSWSVRHPLLREEGEAKPAHVFGADSDPYKVCEHCLAHCDDCGIEVCGAIEGDSYDEGIAFHVSDEVYCVDCIPSEGEDAEEEEDE